MKIKDLILISIIIAVLALATYNITIEQYTDGGILGAIAFYTLTYVIVSIVREKRLESEILSIRNTLSITNQDRISKGYEIERLETDLANQVKATDIAEKKLRLKPIGYFVKTKFDVIYGVETDIPYIVYAQNGECVSIINNSLELIDVNLDYGEYKKFDYDEFKYDIPFSEDTPYIGQMVKVKYGSTYKVAPITRILDEGAKGLRYRVRGCGSAKYKVSDFRDYDENEIPDYGVKLTKKE